MFLATQVLPVCLSCFHCLFLIVTVLCLLTSWACWPTLGKVDKGSKHWTKQSPAFSLCSFSLSHPLSPLISHWLFIVPSSPPFSLFGGVSINIWRSRAAHWQREPIHPPSPSLFSRSLSFSLAQLLCMCACCCGSQIAHWGDAGSWLWSELTERGISVDLLSGLSRTPWQHLSLLLLLLITHSSFEVNFSLFLILNCWSDSLITKSFRGDPYSHPLRRPRCSSSTIGGRGIHRLWHDGDLGIGCKLELGVRASGAALLRGSESAQSVQPATDPCAQEAQQHWGQAMGPRPQQAAQTKGFWLTYVHTHTSCGFAL